MNNKQITLIVVLMTSFITTFTGSALNLSIPAISSQFQAGALSTNWIVTGYILASAALSVPFGRFADLYGKKTVLVTGSIIFAAFSLLCALSWNIQTIIAFRLLQGVGASMIFATNTALLAASYPPESRGRMLGLSVSANYLGHSLGPAAGGIINQHLGWRAVFYITAAYCLIMILLAIFQLKEPSAQQKNSAVQLKEPVTQAPPASGSVSSAPAVDPAALDLPGCILYISAISLTMYGLTDMMTGWLAKVILAAGILLTILFVSRELRIPSPLLEVSLFKKNIPFTFSNLAVLLNHGASYAVNYLLSIYLQNVQGYPSQTAGIILITSPVFQTLLSPLTGRLSDRISPFRLAAAGMAFTTAGIFMFIFISSQMSLIYIIAALAITGIGFALFSSPNSNAIMGSVSKEQYSMASSVMATSRSVGHTASMAVVSSVVAITVGNITLAEADPAAIINAMRISFTVFTLLCTLGIYCSAKRK